MVFESVLVGWCILDFSVAVYTDFEHTLSQCLDCLGTYHVRTFLHKIQMGRMIVLQINILLSKVIGDFLSVNKYIRRPYFLCTFHIQLRLANWQRFSGLWTLEGMWDVNVVCADFTHWLLFVISVAKLRQGLMEIFEDNHCFSKYIYR